MQNALTLAGYVALLVRFSALGGAGAARGGRAGDASPRCASRARPSGCATGARPSRAQLNYLEYVLANDEHAKEVKLFGLGPLLLGRYRALAETFYREDQRAGGARARAGRYAAVAGRHGAPSTAATR